jgi:crotonobetainyl-CoA:carnitine CoA-transferase CaiB-like acyl-CoA transferase
MAAMQRNPQLIEFMESEGMADDFLKGFDWSTFDYTTTTQEIVDRLEEPTARFFMAHTKSELLEGAIKYGVTLYPTNTTRDILADDQLGARGYWAQVEHPELGARITYPGPFAHTSEMPPKVSCRAPLIGEHNEEIYEKELGMSKGELLILRQANVI